MKKEINCSGTIKLMSFEETYEQFKKTLYRICYKWTINGYEFDDLFQIASMGLMTAYENYSDTNIAFSTYLYGAVRYKMLRTVRDNKYKLLESLDEPIIKEDGCTFSKYEYIEDNKNPYEQLEIKNNIEYAFSKLNKKQQDILKLTLEGKTREEIAKLYNVNRTQISRILKKIKEIFKRNYEAGWRLEQKH